MKCLGILGGMSWESTQLYYQQLNRGVRQRLGGLHSAEVLLKSVDFAQVEQWQADDDWDSAGQYLADCACQLKAGGADGLLIATNTMHKVADVIVEQSGLELIHIADCTGQVLKNQGTQKVALLATAYTMEQTFYRQRLIDRFDLDVLVPGAEDRKTVHDIIYQELCLGQIRPESQQAYKAIAEKLVADGAESIILGCTEIGMLLTPEVTDIPLLDTTQVHAEQAVNWMLSAD